MVGVNLKVSREFSPDITGNQIYRRIFGEKPIEYLHSVQVSFTSGRSSPISKIVEVDPRAVIAIPYSSERLSSMLNVNPSDLAALIRERPPKVAEVRLKDRSSVYIIVEDGNHRIAAARAHRMHKLEAEVVSLVDSSDGSRFALFNGNVLEYQEGHFTFAFNLGFELAAIAERILRLKGADVITNINSAADVYFPFGGFGRVSDLAIKG